MAKDDDTEIPMSEVMKKALRDFERLEMSVTIEEATFRNIKTDMVFHMKTDNETKH